MSLTVDYAAGRKVLSDRADSHWQKRIDAIREQRAAGKTLKEIAKENQTSEYSIRRVLRKYKQQENDKE